MNYIGSKNKLSDFIYNTINQSVSNNLTNLIFCDLFAGTGIIGRKFKPYVNQVISNDIEYYSFVLNSHYIINNQIFNNSESLIHELNELKLKEGFIYNNYCFGSGSERNYFSDENGKKIDTIRQKIEEWKLNKKICEKQYFFLLTSLLESADKVANTASVYGAFLKHIKSTAQKKLLLEPAQFTNSKNINKVFCKDANVLITEIEGDILYLDPPYNARQYGANYHILNTIALYDDFIPKGKTGLRNYFKSGYCTKKTAFLSLENLIKNAKFKTIFLSYNNEGILTFEEIKNIMQKFGSYNFEKLEYQRFKADTDINRNHKSNKTIEYLHILKK